MKDFKSRNDLRKSRASLEDGPLNRKLNCFFRSANKLSSYKPSFRNFITMSKLNALNSDCYIDIGKYKDQHFHGDIQEHQELKQQSHTLYVGNLSFYTTEEQVYELFSKSGDVKRIIIGLDKVKKTACGFCFVEYYTRSGAENAMRFINGTRLDDRMIRTDWDTGFREGRQYGRGKSGGQIRDEYRKDYDPARGGYGKMAQPNPAIEIRNSF